MPLFFLSLVIKGIIETLTIISGARECADHLGSQRFVSELTDITSNDCIPLSIMGLKRKETRNPKCSLPQKENLDI